MSIQKYTKIKMKCERCKEQVSTMIAIPRRHNAQGEVTCFMNLCIKCAKEVLNERDRKMSKMSKFGDGQSRPGKKSIPVRELRPVVRRVVKGEKNGKKNIEGRKRSEKKNANNTSRFRVGLSARVRKKGSNKLRNDGKSSNL